MSAWRDRSCMPLTSDLAHHLFNFLPVNQLFVNCLSEEQVQMWWDHLQQNALNRARGVEKAKATRQRKKQEKKNDTMSV